VEEDSGKKKKKKPNLKTVSLRTVQSARKSRCWDESSAIPPRVGARENTRGDEKE